MSNFVKRTTKNDILNPDSSRNFRRVGFQGGSFANLKVVTETSKRRRELSGLINMCLSTLKEYISPLMTTPSPPATAKLINRSIKPAATPIWFRDSVLELWIRYSHCREEDWCRCRATRPREIWDRPIRIRVTNTRRRRESVCRFLYVAGRSEEEIRIHTPVVISCNEGRKEVAAIQYIANKQIDRTFAFDKILEWILVLLDYRLCLTEIQKSLML